MSSDLWAAFGTGGTEAADNPWASQAPAQSVKPGPTQQNQSIGTVPLPTTTTGDVSDPWASFETAALNNEPVAAPGPPPVDDDWADFESAEPATLAGAWSSIEPAVAGPNGDALQGASSVTDPWAAFEGAASTGQSAGPTTTKIVPAASALEAPRAGGGGAVDGSEPVEQDDWSIYEKPQSTLREPDGTFNDAGLMWDADAALEDEAPLSTQGETGGIRSADRPRFGVGTQQPGSLIDISGLDLGPDGHNVDGDWDDDDFGDFEEAENSAVRSPVQAVKPKKTTPRKQNVSAAILQNRIETQGTGAATKLIFGAVKKGSGDAQGSSSGSVSAATTSTARARKASLPKSAPKAIAKASAEEDIDDEAWDDFDAVPSEPPSKPQASTSIRKPTASSSSKSHSNSTPESLPPSNVPPPSVLLSLIHNTLLPALTTSKPPPSSSSSSSPSSSLSPNPLLRTTAHILAGRKPRWKRDTHLAQSMSISASGPGLRSGMKLTGIDRSEAVREDREAAEVVRVFKAGAGALRARAVKAGEKGIVDLAGKGGVGGLVAREEKGGGSGSGSGGGTGAAKPCVVCGLRRAERVVGVDGEVYDGFGEWWVEHWGHRECKEWWEENEEKLRAR